jgi:hypothetical protein
MGSTKREQPIGRAEGEAEGETVREGGSGWKRRRGAMDLENGSGWGEEIC